MVYDDTVRHAGLYSIDSLMFVTKLLDTVDRSTEIMTALLD